jgi:hypothetical protein
MNYNQQYTNQQPLSHDSQPVPLRGPFLSGTHFGSGGVANARTAQQTGHCDSQALNACTGRSSIGRSLTPLRMANTLQQHGSGC